jgi:nucleoside-diphosphate-sugar epimerase
MREDKPEIPVLIVGCGYIGRRVAARLATTPGAVTGLVRSADSARRLQAEGTAAWQADLDGRVPALRARAVYYFAPPPATGEEDTRMRHFLAALAAPPRRIVYISTSAVYGDCHGEWIDETRATAPTTPRGQRRLDAERQLVNWCGSHGTQWTILRVPGIYGPGKLPLERLRKGLPVLREADAPYTNRIHADDLASIAIAAMHSVHHDTVYNVSDGHPGNMTDYFFRVADAAGLPRPREVARAEADAVLSAGMLSFLQDSRRMDNSKLLKELGIVLAYPDLASGLAQCLQGGGGVA